MIEDVGAVGGFMACLWDPGPFRNSVVAPPHMMLALPELLRRAADDIERKMGFRR